MTDVLQAPGDEAARPGPVEHDQGNPRVAETAMVSSIANCLRASDLERLCRSIVLSRIVEWRGQAPLDLCARTSLREGAAALDSLELLEVIADLNRRFALNKTGIEDYLLATPNIEAWQELLAHHLETLGSEATVTFASSGSQGDPKQITHRLSSLVSEVQAARPVFGDTPSRGAHTNPCPSSHYQDPKRPIRSGKATAQPLVERSQEGAERLRKPLASETPSHRIVSLVQPHHIFGFLFTLLIPARHDWAVLDLSRAAPGRLATALQPGDLIVATPYQLDLALKAAPSDPIPDNVSAIVSGAAAPPELWRDAGRRKISMREIYGSTETAGVGWRASQDAPFTLFADVESRATEESSKHPNPVPELSRCGLPLALQDELNWIGPRSFHVGARHDRKVQIAGVNVSVEEVAEVLRAHPEVAAAAVRLDPATARLKAFVVPRAEAVTRDDLEALLRTHATQHLISAARPQAYTFGAELPVSAAGKPTDW